jgi:hypothetical protein
VEGYDAREKIEGEEEFEAERRKNEEMVRGAGL